MTVRVLPWLFAAQALLVVSIAHAQKQAASDAAPAARAAEQPANQIPKLLFDAYVGRQGKINTETVMAATHIVAETGRSNGFWKEVLAELQKKDERSEIGCVRVLGKMLAIDAAARDHIRMREAGVISAWNPHVCLGPEVAETLIERGKEADRFRIDHYTIALARARVPEAKDFFVSILQARSGPAPGAGGGDPSAPSGYFHLESTRFHAAVGLAQLGEPMGVEWLIQNCEDVNGSVSNAWPPAGRWGGSLGRCCTAALQQLSGEHNLTTHAEWKAWWQTADREFLKTRAATMVDM